jgi:hypothetical protein
MKQQTAMQQHIEWLKATLDICKETAPTLVNCINLCISDSESRLGIEKEQIRDAFNAGDLDAHTYFIPFLKENDESENYYNQTFKSE